MASKILLVEGTDDLYVLRHLCEQRGIPELDDIKHLDGVGRLLDNIPVQLRARNEDGDVVGVVMDADTDLDSRWQSIRSRVSEFGYIVPEQPDKGGTIIDPPVETVYPRFGVWVMPNNQTPGILENFLQFLVPDGDVLLTYAKTCLQNLPDRRFILNDEPKAVIHTWLAWQKDPGKPYGTAIKAKFLDPHLPEADFLVDWIRQLFFPDS